jgi:hypothetical protein
MSSKLSRFAYAGLGLIAGAALMFGALELRGEAEAQTPSPVVEAQTPTPIAAAEARLSPCEAWGAASNFLTGGNQPFVVAILTAENQAPARWIGLEWLLDRCLELGY